MPRASSATGARGRARSTSRGRPAPRQRTSRSRSRTPSRGRPSKKAATDKVVEVKIARLDPEEYNLPSAKKATPKPKSGNKKRDVSESKARSPSSGRRHSTRVAARVATAAIIKDSTPKAEKQRHDSSSGERDPGLLWSLSTLLWAGCIVGISLAMISLASRPRECSIWNFRIPLVSKKMLMDVDTKLLASSFLFLGFQALVQVLPLGSLVTGPSTSSGFIRHRMNGLIAFVVTLALIPFLPSAWTDYAKDSTKVLKKTIYMSVMAFLLSVVLYVKARNLPSYRLNPTGNTSRMFVNWYAGREVQPRIFGFNVKTFLFRVGLIGSAALVAFYPYTLWEEKKMFSPTLFMAAFMQLIYVAAYFWDEEGFLYCYENTMHGTGFEACSMLIMPAVYSVNIRYLYTSLVTGRAGTELPLWAVFTLGFVWLVGFVMMMSANRTKNGFRKNPNDDRFSDLTTQAGKGTKKLICSGLWGWVRHPNYLGDIIQAFCWAASTGAACGVFYVYPAMLVFFLWYRAVMVEQTCARKYGVAWEKYCLRVPNRIIPGCHF